MSIHSHPNQFFLGFGYGFGYETHTQTQTQNFLGVNVCSRGTKMRCFKLHRIEKMLYSARHSFKGTCNYFCGKARKKMNFLLNVLLTTYKASKNKCTYNIRRI